MSGIDVAAICAHPDDAEAMAGGTLCREAKRGRRVAIVDLTAGELGSRGTPSLRAEEAAEAARILGVVHRECAGLPDAHLATTTEQKDCVVAILRRLRPAVVVVHHEKDARHPDHAVASRLVKEAAFLSGLVRYRPDLGGPFRPSHVLHALPTLPCIDVAPTFVVDIGDEWEQKLLALRAYGSQFLPPPGTASNPLDRSLDNVDLASRLHGAAVGVARGEGFTLSGPVEIEGPSALVRT